MIPPPTPLRPVPSRSPGWLTGVCLVTILAAKTAAVAQELPGGGEQELKHHLDLLRESIATPRAVIPLHEAFYLRFSVRDRARIREAIEWAAASKEASHLIRANAEYLLSQMDVTAGDLEAAASRRRSIGTIMDWFVIGAFDNEGKSGYDREYPPEKCLKLDATWEGERGTVTWRNTAGLFPIGHIDLFNLCRPNLNVLAYALAFVKVEKAATLALRLSTDDAVKAWVNGELVHGNNVYRPMTFDQDAVPVRLGAGWNSVLLKVLQGEGEWELQARLTEPNGRPFTQFQTAKTVEAAQTLETVGPQPPGEVKIDTLLAALEAEAKSKPKSARPHGDLAWYYAHTMHFEITERQHEAAYQRAIALAPWYPEFYYRLGRIAQEPNQARLWLRRASQLAPQFAQPRSLLASHYYGRGNYRKAMELADEAIEKQPGLMSPYLVKADILANHYARTPALDLLERIRKERFPDSPGVLLRMAVLYDKLGQYDEAQRLRQATLKVSCFHEEARVGLANEAKTRGRLPAFLEQYDALLKLRPAKTLYLLTQAEHLLARQKPEQAAALCRRALAVCPKDSIASDLLGRCLHDQGKTEEAIEAWELSLELKPQNAGLQEYVEFLEPDEEPFEAEYIRDATELAKAPFDPKQYPDESIVCLLSLSVRRIHANGLDSSFNQLVYRILTEKGARDLASYSVHYTPEAQRFITKKARVIKPSGEIVTVAPPTTHRLDRSKDNLYYDRQVKAYRIRNLEAGDVVEIQYQLDDTAAENKFAEYFGALKLLRWKRPCQLLEYVLITPRDRKLHHQSVGESLEPEIKNQGDDTVHVWRLKDAPSFVPESRMPGYTEVVPYLHISTYDKWEDLGRWYAGLIRDQFALDENGKTLAREVTADKKTDLDKIKALHNYLARKTRYVGLEFGIHGHKPYPAWKVLARGHGDCKDKATLLCSMLDEIGIEASVALVRTQDKGALDAYPPSLHPFNHAIAYVPNHKLWLDCTVRYSGSTELPPTDQGAMALIVNRDGSSQLTTIPRTQAEDNRYEQTYDITLDAKGTADMKVTRRIVGRPTAGYRRSFAIEKKRRQLLERKWGKRFPGTRASEVKFSDLQDLESPVSYSCRLRLPRFAAKEDGEMSFDHNLTNYRFVERYASLSERRHAYVMRYVFQATFDTTVHLPEGYRFTARVSDADLKTPFGAMTRKCVVDGEKMTITQNIQIDAWRVEPTDYPAWRKFCMAMDEKLTEKIRISR